MVYRKGAFMADRMETFQDDPLIQGLVTAKGKKIEAFAFGITYVGTLTNIDHENGFISITDGEDTAMLELERIEHFNVIEE